jgi:hypothetical protein
MRMVPASTAAASTRQFVEQIETEGGLVQDGGIRVAQDLQRLGDHVVIRSDGHAGTHEVDRQRTMPFVFVGFALGACFQQCQGAMTHEVVEPGNDTDGSGRLIVAAHLEDGFKNADEKERPKEGRVVEMGE